MFFRVPGKILRFILKSLIGVVLLLTALFALLQSKWAKNQIGSTITSALQEAGITAHVQEVGGQLPFTWTIQAASLTTDEGEHLELHGIKFRFAILPLLRGKLAISLLKIEEASYRFSQVKEINLDEAKALVREHLDAIHLPFPISIDHYAINSLTLINQIDDSRWTVAATGQVKIRKDLQQFTLDLRLFSPEENRTFLDVGLTGNRKKNMASARAKIDVERIPAFLFPHVRGGVAAELSIEGPWTTWDELLHNLPRTQGKLTGTAQGSVTHLQLTTAHFLSGDWQFKSRFEMGAEDQIDFQKLLLSSNLIQIKGRLELNADAHKSKAALAFTLPTLAPFSFVPNLPLSGSARGKILFQEGHFQTLLETQDLTTAQFAAGSVQVAIKGSLEAGKWRAHASFHSDDAEIAFKAQLGMEYLPGNLLKLQEIHLRAPDIDLSGTLQYHIPEHLSEGTLHAHVGHLDRFAAYVKEPSLNGHLTADIALSTENKTQQATCVVTATHLRYQDFLVDSLNISAHLEDLLHAAKGSCNLLAEKIYTPSFYLDNLHLGTHASGDKWPFYIDTRGRIENPFEAYIKGSWKKEGALFSAECTQFSGELSEIPFTLERPCEIAWQPHSFLLNPLDLKIGDGHLSGMFVLKEEILASKWEMHHFPLEILGCLRPRFGLNGFVTTSGFLEASATHCQGALNAVLEEAGVLHYGKKEPFQAKGSIQAHLSGGIAQVYTDLRATDGQFLDLNATLPIKWQLHPFSFSIDPHKNTSAELIAEGRLQDLFDFVNMGTHHLTGLLSCRLFLAQTLSSPSVQGELELQEGTYENYFTGLNLHGIHALFEARHDAIDLVNLTASDDKSGEVDITGKLLLKPEEHFPYAFEAQMNHLHALRFDMIDCDLSGPLYLTGDIKQMTAQGNLLVDEAKIQVMERLPYEIPSLPVTYVNRPPHLISRTVAHKPGFAFHIDLELTSDGHVRVLGKGLEAELEGHIHLHGTDINIAADGNLKLLSGEYIFSGKIFKLTEGEVVFKDKPTPTAYLNLNGTLNLPDVTITAMLRGPLTAPQLTFQSNPQKPTSSLLALILFNKDIADISQPEALQLASTLMSLSGGAGPDVLESIRRSIGIDRLNIASKPGTDELAVQIGKYLTRGVLVTLSQSATSSQVIVEVELPKGFVFQAETQEEEEGKFSLKWRKSY